MKTLLFAFIISLAGLPCSAQWKSAGWQGYDGGNVLAFGVHDTSLFIGIVKNGPFGSEPSLVYRSEPYGAAGWVAADNGMDQTQEKNVNSFAAIGSYFFAGFADGLIYKLSNRDTVWDVNDSIGTPICSNGYYLFADNAEGIARSTDSGKTWQTVDNLIVNSSYSANGDCIFANTGSAIWRSFDTGSHWFQIHPPLMGMITPMDSLLFIVANGSVAESTDSGSNWTMVPVDSAGVPWYVNVLSTDGKNLFAGTKKGLLVSTDFGKTWQPHNDGFVDAYHNNTMQVTVLGIFDTLLYAEVLCNNVDTFDELYVRPISELTGPPAAVAQASPPGDSIEVYPNPATGMVTIVSGGTSILGVQVLNVLGTEVVSLPVLRESAMTVDLSKLPSGTYFLEIETEEGTVLRKVVRE